MADDIGIDPATVRLAAANVEIPVPLPGYPRFQPAIAQTVEKIDNQYQHTGNHGKEPHRTPLVGLMDGEERSAQTHALADSFLHLIPCSSMDLRHRKRVSLAIDEGVRGLPDTPVGLGTTQKR
jgi:hypothetical protein